MIMIINTLHLLKLGCIPGWRLWRHLYPFLVLGNLFPWFYCWLNAQKLLRFSPGEKGENLFPWFYCWLSAEESTFLPRGKGGLVRADYFIINSQTRFIPGMCTRDPVWDCFGNNICLYIPLKSSQTGSLNMRSA